MALLLSGLAGCFIAPDDPFCVVDGDTLAGNFRSSDQCCSRVSDNASAGFCADFYTEKGVSEDIASKAVRCTPHPDFAEAVNGVCTFDCAPGSCECATGRDCSDGAACIILDVDNKAYCAQFGFDPTAIESCIACASCSLQSAADACGDQACAFPTGASPTAIDQRGGFCRPCALASDRLGVSGTGGCGLDGDGNARLCYPTAEGSTACMTPAETLGELGQPCDGPNTCEASLLCVDIRGDGQPSCQQLTTGATEDADDAMFRRCNKIDGAPTFVPMAELGEDLGICLCGGTEPVNGEGKCAGACNVDNQLDACSGRLCACGPEDAPQSCGADEEGTRCVDCDPLRADCAGPGCCPTSLGCYPDAEGFACATPSATARGEWGACTMHTDCADGHICLDGVCRKACDTERLDTNTRPLVCGLLCQDTPDAPSDVCGCDLHADACRQGQGCYVDGDARVCLEPAATAAAAGEPCDAPNACEAGLVCIDGSCQEPCLPSKTPTGMSCSAGMGCVFDDAARLPLCTLLPDPAKAQWESCANSAECGDNLTCEGGVCRRMCVGGGGDTACGDSTLCDDIAPRASHLALGLCSCKVTGANPCPDGQSCYEDAGAATCAAPAANAGIEGEGCTTFNGCALGLICRDTLCRTPCVANGDCTSNVCTNSVCAL